jgi:hypothetical protein
MQCVDTAFAHAAFNDWKNAWDDAGFDSHQNLQGASRAMPRSRLLKQHSAEKRVTNRTVLPSEGVLEVCEPESQ